MKTKTAFLLVLFLSFPLWGQLQVTSPSSSETVASAREYASESFQDPWDMDKVKDLGWFTYDAQGNWNFWNFTGGRFVGSSTSSDPVVWLLDTGAPGSALLGKIGTNHPIDGDTFKVLAFRMKVDHQSFGQVFWSKNTIYAEHGGGISCTPGFVVRPGWRVYVVNVPSLGVSIPNQAGSWEGALDSLRFDPANYSSGENVEIDWVRLLEDTPSLYRNITWTGYAGGVDIYLDDDTDPSNGNLGLAAENVSGGSFSLYVGALAPGEYRVAMRASGTGNALVYAPGSYRVNDLPLLSFTSPSPEGSGDDFATVQLADPWDMDKLADVDYMVRVNNPSVTTGNFRDEAGSPLNNLRVLTGTSAAAPAGTAGDPVVYPLLWYNGGRGETHKINSDRYRILSLRMGLPGQRDLVNGSVVRIVWKGSTESVENVSQDVLVNSLAGTPVIDTIIADMKSLPLEDGAGSPSHSGWTGLIDGFRVDPHEFSDPLAFYLQDVKLSAFERADLSYRIAWNFTNGTGTPTLSLSFSSSKTGPWTPIASSLNPTSGEYLWDTSGVAQGTYYLKAEFGDGLNTNSTLSPWPVVVDHGLPPPEIALSRSALTFGSKGSAFTDPQSFTVSNSGEGTLSWTALDNQSWLSLTPVSGTGSANITVSVNPSGLSAGTYTGTITVSDPAASNSPRTVTVTLHVYASAAAGKPYGVFDTPGTGTTVRSSIPVTGWALDDLQVDTVKIYREDGASLAYVADALFIDGSRPDVEAAYPGVPLNSRGGWGVMLLTNFLPYGDGVYKIHALAVDKEGNTTDLGTKTITVDNAHAAEPFGAIDTPVQGGVASGTGYVNFGWVLTPTPYSIPTDGHTLNVWVDGAPLGHPVYNNYRQDIADLFPGYLNSNGAVGYYFLNTTGYANGLHTIAWSAVDDGGRETGVGSRYFLISNLSAGVNPWPGAPLAGTPSQTLPDRTSLFVSKGWSEAEEGEELSSEGDGTFLLKMAFGERIAVKLGEGSWRGYLRVGEEFRPLPVGSTLRGGSFFWQPGPGFRGEFNLFFHSSSGFSRLLKVRLLPKGTRETTAVDGREERVASR